MGNLSSAADIFGVKESGFGSLVFGIRLFNFVLCTWYFEALVTWHRESNA
jgi:hypothetical protein